MKNGFFFYENFKTTADSLPDDLRLKFYDALTNYAINGVEPEDNILKALITAFKPSINKIETRGGNNNPTGQNQYSEVKRGQKEVKSGQSGQSFNKQETGNIKQEEKEKNNLKVIKKEKFKKPTIEEINLYCRERNNTISGEQFFNFYESKGWRVGNQAMKDWKAAVRTWEAKERTLNAAKDLVRPEDYKPLSWL